MDIKLKIKFALSDDMIRQQLRRPNELMKYQCKIIG